MKKPVFVQSSARVGVHKTGMSSQVVVPFPWSWRGRMVDEIEKVFMGQLWCLTQLMVTGQRSRFVCAAGFTAVLTDALRQVCLRCTMRRLLSAPCL